MPGIRPSAYHSRMGRHGPALAHELDDLIWFVREQLPRGLTAEERMKYGIEATTNE